MASPRLSKVVPTLEDLCLTSYLKMLQRACAGYVHLSRLKSSALARAQSNMFAVLKAHLNSNLSGTMSTVLREEMIQRLLSGKYPAPEFHNQYDSQGEHSEFLVADLGTDADRKNLDEIKTHGQKCCSVCCTGAFIVETMVAVIINEDMRELRFDMRADRFWHKNKLIRKYVPIQVPAILSHYTQAVNSTFLVKIPKLERIIIKGTDIPSRTFAMKNNHFEVLTTYQETEHYLQIPGALSEEGHTMQYGAFTEHLMQAIGDMLSPRDSFVKLTEIVLGREACNTSLKMQGTSQRSIGTELFRGIGLACPNLRILDVSSAINVSAECILYLFFHDAYGLLHQFVYMPPYEINYLDQVVQNNYCDEIDVTAHDPSVYCPYCLDEWCANGMRCGLEFLDVQMPVIDDRLYEAIEDNFLFNRKRYLMNVLKASDLVRSIDGHFYQLKRPAGPAPWDEDFEPPAGAKPYPDGNDVVWYEPAEVKYEQFWLPVMNKICQSLQCLKLNMDQVWPKHEIVPFLLKALPNVKSLGHINVVRGLKMIRDIPALNGISAMNLEEIDFNFGGVQANKYNAHWADDAIYDYVETFGQDSSEWDDNIDKKRQQLISDVALVASECPNLRIMEIFLFGEQQYLFEDDADIWRPFDALSALRELRLHSHQWSEVIALLSTIGSRLTKLYLAFDGRGSMWDQVGPHVPTLDELLALCPNVEHLTLSYNIKTVQISDRPPESLSLSRLKHFAVHTYMTKKAFEFLWTKATNIETLNVTHIVAQDVFPHPAEVLATVVQFSEDDVARLTKANPMSSLVKMDVAMSIKNIATARLLIERLGSASVIGFLSVRVGLAQEHYPDQEQMMHGLASVMQAMRQFKLFCLERTRTTGVKIQWKWERVGFLESLAEMYSIEQFDAWVEPNVA